MSVSPVEYLQHNLDETAFLMDRAVGLELDDFFRDEVLQRAFGRSLEIIGEAAKKMPAELRPQHREVEWRALAGMRDRLIRA